MAASIRTSLYGVSGGLRPENMPINFTSGVVQNVSLTDVSSELNGFLGSTVQRLEVEVEAGSSNIVITSKKYLSGFPGNDGKRYDAFEVRRTVLEGVFSFANNNLIGSSIQSVSYMDAVYIPQTKQLQRWSIKKTQVSGGVDIEQLNNRDSIFWRVPDPDPNVVGYSFRDFDDLGIISDQTFFKDQWHLDPFSSALISESTQVNPSNTSTQVTTVNPDVLTGVSSSRDVFQFAVTPSFADNADKIISFSVKDKDAIQISRSVFGIANGRFAVAKKPKSLNKLLASDVDIVYNQKAGQLILNDNGAEPSFGTDGGVFALLVGNPKITPSSVSFI